MTRALRTASLTAYFGLASAMVLCGVAAPALADLCPGDNGGLKLPKGFCATVYADGLGQPRHIAVASDGTVYVNVQGRAGWFSGGSFVALKDTTGDGRADVVAHFGESLGGTGVAIYDGGVFFETGDRIIRYERHDGDIALKSAPETIVSGLPLNGDHTMHPFAIAPNGDLFVDLGSATNSCQRDNRADRSPGLTPCEELKTRAGIWRYDAKKKGQTFSAAERFATGLRNSEGIDFDAAGRIFATQHGRDQLYENWPKLYSSRQGSELPAEELVLLADGGDYGWPSCYFDRSQQKLVLSPEYGGDGKSVGLCAEKRAPVAAFPAHWAPNDLVIYKGTQFPEAYRGGAFIAFHGSWNRSFGPQGGYNVVFQPLADGKASGDYAVFADGFAGNMLKTGHSDHRPTGLAVGPDGSLYVSDDGAGRIWRITYKG